MKHLSTFQPNVQKQNTATIKELDLFPVAPDLSCVLTLALPISIGGGLSRIQRVGSRSLAPRKASNASTSRKRRNLIPNYEKLSPILQAVMRFDHVTMEENRHAMSSSTSPILGGESMQNPIDVDLQVVGQPSSSTINSVVDTTLTLGIPGLTTHSFSRDRGGHEQYNLQLTLGRECLF
ncbi:unnamed protein product [Lathyrus oleraceus]|uniref:uncharacterized protein LOC127115515 n=1 Tax=Pisum sativum TaxID=3888 RepID=UPI001FC506F0|nr:uncharacterized protein LOC127115515 [Pisum sativum]